MARQFKAGGESFRLNLFENSRKIPRRGPRTVPPLPKRTWPEGLLAEEELRRELEERK